MDSLRYWVTEMHVDGFRFDLAATLARELHDVDRLSRLLRHHPPGSRSSRASSSSPSRGTSARAATRSATSPCSWTEWNGRYRDTVRRFWKGDGALVAELGYRLTGSSDLYEHDGRQPHASINFVTAHDGFTLHDLVTYEQKHNEANGEENRDGSDDNDCWNYGVEGETDDPAIERAPRAPEAELPRDAAALAGRADALRRRRDGPHAARQQQRLLPGQRDLLARLGARRAAARAPRSSRAGCSRCAPASRCCAGRKLLLRRLRARQRAPATSPGSAPTAPR